jgi:hypothetical protein
LNEKLRQTTDREELSIKDYCTLNSQLQKNDRLHYNYLIIDLTDSEGSSDCDYHMTNFQRTNNVFRIDRLVVHTLISHKKKGKNKFFLMCNEMTILQSKF